MYFDVFTISTLVDEFTGLLLGGHIQDSIDVDESGLGLEIYADRRRHYLYLSADPHTPRVHLASDKLRRGLTRPTQLGLVFRSYVEGGVVTRISQPEWERILHIGVQGPKGDVTIIVEPMERRSNILLVQDGVIVDCMRRVGPEDNRYRLSLPAHEYVPPPPLTGRHDPTTITLSDVHGIFEQNTDARRKTHQVLSSRILGVSPLLAREIVRRAGAAIDQKADDAAPDALVNALREMLEPLAQRVWQPGLVEGADGIAAYSVYPIQHLSGWRPVPTVSEALVAYYGEPAGADAYHAAKVPVRAALREAQLRTRARLDSLEGSLKDEHELEILRKSGELLLAYQYTLNAGQTELHARYEPDAPELVIQLDPELSPVENAQRYFIRYSKAKRAREEVPQLIETTQNEMAFLEQLVVDLELATNWPEIDEVWQALQESGHWRGRKAERGGGGRSAPLRIVSRDGFLIWVGRNSRQNEEVTFKKGGGQDLWLHARGAPGAHVVIKFDGRDIPPAVIQQAASLAAYYSAQRDEGSVLVDVTQCKYVRKIKGAGPGMVTYRNEETRAATPQSEADLQR